MGNLANRVPGTLKALSKAQFESNRQQTRVNLACSGIVEYGKHYTSSESHNPAEGLFAFPNVPLSLQSGRDRELSGVQGNSVSDYPILNVDGVIIHLTNANHISSASDWRLPEAPNAHVEISATTSRIYRQGDHVVVGNDIYICVSYNDVPAGSNLLDNNLFESRAVVTDECLLGVEVFCVELGKDIDVVYPTGCVQNQTQTWNGFTLNKTLISKTYSELGHWQGDNAKPGYGHVWSSMDAVQRNVWLSDSKNNIYEENGNYFQWQYRLKTTQGLGEAWTVDRPSTLSNSAIRGSSGRLSSPETLLRLRGKRVGEFKDIGPDNGAIVFTYHHADRPMEVDWGVGVTRENNGAVTGPVTDSPVAYYLPIAAVTRLNQGGYHPIFNPLGTKTFRRQDINGDNRWDNVNVFQPTTVADCFKIGETAQSEGIHPATGNYESGKSGHPLNYYHDSIYAHLVNDLRFSAYGAELSAENIAYKMMFNKLSGWEPLKRTVLHRATITELPNDHRVVLSSLPAKVYIGGGWLYNVTKQIHSPCMRFNAASEFVQTLPMSVNPLAISPGLATSSALTLGEREGNWEVGDEVILIQYENINVYMKNHCYTDVVGVPDKILDYLQGHGMSSAVNFNWIPVVPDGTLKEYRANRKVNTIANAVLVSNDDGGTWFQDTSALSGYIDAANGNHRTVQLSQLQLVQYEATGKIFGYDDLVPGVEFSQKIQHAEGADISGVWVSVSAHDHLGGAVMQSALGEVARGSAATPLRYAIERHGLSKLSYGWGIDASLMQRPAHTELDYMEPSHGIKYFVTLGYHPTTGLVYPQVTFKKVFHNAPLIPTTPIDLSTNPVVDLKKGERIRLVNTRNSNIENVVLSMVEDYSGQWATATFDKHQISYDDGRVYRENGTYMSIAVVAPIAKYGDDGEFYANPSDAIQYQLDLNGNIVMTGTLLSTKPLGFLPKKYRS